MTLTPDTKITPMMEQWHACKKIAGEAFLFFRMGDFYEAFYQDAELIAKALELTLTKRQEVPMCGVPVHTCEMYIDRLVSKGYRIAVAEQMEDPRAAKGLVKREIVRVVTPGSVINSSLLSEKSNNYFASLHRVGSSFGLAYVDLTTSEFRLIELHSEQELLNEIYRIHPQEFLVSKKFQGSHANLFKDLKQSYAFLINTLDEWNFDLQITHHFLANHLGVISLEGHGLGGMTAGIQAAGALLAYIQDNLCLPIQQIQAITPYTLDQYMVLNRTTQRNLELTESLHEGSKQTLLQVLDHTCTPMGGRLLRQWVKQPLLDPALIAERQEATALFHRYDEVATTVRNLLNPIRDLERLTVKIGSGYASPRDLVSLRFSLEPVPKIKAYLSAAPILPPLLRDSTEKLDELTAVTSLIAQALVDEPPARLSDGQLIREGFHQELDTLRDISKNSKQWIANYQTHLRDQTGIKTLKVGYNKISGYFIEVSKGQADRVPDIFERRQTLVNSERFISPELKDYESKVLTAEDKISTIESELFHAIRQEVSKYSKQIQAIASALAHIDCFQSLAFVAKRYNYVRPIVDNSHLIHITEGRHPVIEAAAITERFIPNDTLLDNHSNRLLLITGPNMAGKSTYIRQVALIAIMAQIGSFVPAKEAHLGIVDKVFTRIGASDDLSRGQSTFMVEMTETANILHNATDRSLVILDEIGRGTSTYDGISIAWSVAEYLLTAEGKRAKTLFATHYWELTKLQEKVPGAINYHVSVSESADSIVFLRKIVRGDTDKSYGIHVGRLAGLPSHVVERAKEILNHLEQNANRKGIFEPGKVRKPPVKKNTVAPREIQLSFF